MQRSSNVASEGSAIVVFHLKIRYMVENVLVQAALKSDTVSRGLEMIGFHCSAQTHGEAFTLCFSDSEIFMTASVHWRLRIGDDSDAFKATA